MVTDVLHEFLVLFSRRHEFRLLIKSRSLFLLLCWWQGKQTRRENCRHEFRVWTSMCTVLGHKIPLGLNPVDLPVPSIRSTRGCRRRLPPFREIVGARKGRRLPLALRPCARPPPEANAPVSAGLFHICLSTTARVSDRTRTIRVCCFAAINNLQMFQSIWPWRSQKISHCCERR